MQKLITTTKRYIALVLYISLFIILITSEVINSFFNNKFDKEGIDSLHRLIISFKPTVIILYLVFTTILLFLVFKYLKPLFYYLKTDFKSREKKKKSYSAARKAVIGLPRAVLIFQFSIWFSGTTVYYLINGWQAESGIPYILGLLLKVSSGILGGMYVVTIINLVLIPLKIKLKMTEIRKHEKDRFTILKDYYAILTTSFYIFIQMAYLSWYFSQSEYEFTLVSFGIPILIVGIILLFIGAGPIFLSKREFRIQVLELTREMEDIEEGDVNKELKPVYICNFDYLGNLASQTNRVMGRLKIILDQINNATQHLSHSILDLEQDSQANASAANGQAAAVAEVVATMEDSNRLSRQMGDSAREVDMCSNENLEKVSKGIETIRRFLNTMEQLKVSNSKAIDFVYSLNENIKTIMDVSTIIKSIADQVKIIAFNAELEAAAAGDAGKNFEIVASEVRRLADNTVNAATEIRDKINLIEKESRNLYDASQNTTEIIDVGWSISQEAEDSFQMIQNTSRATSSAAKSISENIQVQITGFEQILITMKEISATSKDVSSRTLTTAKTVRSLKTILSSLKENVETEDCV